MSSLSLSQAGGSSFLPLGTGEGARAAGTRQGWNGRQGRGRRAAWGLGQPGWLQPAVQAPLVGNTFASRVRTRFSSRGIRPTPPLGSQVARSLPKQAAWSKPRCAKAETAPGNHRIARRRSQEGDSRWGRRRELPGPRSRPQLIPPQYYVTRMEGPGPPAGPDLRVMGSSPARASVLGVESAGASPPRCWLPLPCSLSVSLSLE